MVEGGSEQGPSVEEVARHLRRNGIKATALTVEPGARAGGEIILERAAALGCDLLVKGAYTQSRLRQMIFGGATRHILGDREPAGPDGALTAHERLVRMHSRRTEAAATPSPVPVRARSDLPRRAAGFLTVFPSIMLPMFLAVVDQTIVATALPAIAAATGEVRARLLGRRLLPRRHDHRGADLRPARRRLRPPPADVRRRSRCSSLASVLCAVSTTHRAA